MNANGTTGIADATAAPVTRTIGGKEWQLGVLRNRDCGAYARWRGQQLIEMGRSVMLDPELTRDDKILVLDRAYKCASALSLQSILIDAAGVLPLEDAAYLVWLSLRVHQPEVTLDDIDEMLPLSRSTEMSEIAIRVLEISGIAATADIGGPGGPSDTKTGPDAVGPDGDADDAPVQPEPRPGDGSDHPADDDADRQP